MAVAVALVLPVGQEARAVVVDLSAVVVAQVPLMATPMAPRPRRPGANGVPLPDFGGVFVSVGGALPLRLWRVEEHPQWIGRPS